MSCKGHAAFSFIGRALHVHACTSTVVKSTGVSKKTGKNWKKLEKTGKKLPWDEGVAWQCRLLLFNFFVRQNWFL